MSDLDKLQPTKVERRVAWENGREERDRARKQAIVDRLAPLVGAALDRLSAQYQTTTVVAETDPRKALPPANVLTFDIMAYAVEGALRSAGVDDVSSVRGFIRWEPLGQGIVFDLVGFAGQLADRPGWVAAS